MKDPLLKILQKLEAADKPLAFGTYDFETYDWTKPLCADVFDGQEHDYTIDREDQTAVVRALLFAMESSGCSTFWAHNGGKYDALFVVDCLRQLKGWKCDGAVAAGRIIQLRIMSPHACFTLKDSYAVIQSSLDKALVSFGIPHKKVFTKEEYERLDTLKTFTPGCPNQRPKGGKDCVCHNCCGLWSMRDFSDEKLRKGCQADTEALHALIRVAEDMFIEWGGQLKSTFSASALSVVKAQVGRELVSHEGQQWANDIGKKTYAGGRVEVFKHTPKDWLTELDITSSYPASMSEPLPWFLKGWEAPNLYSKDTLQLVYAKVRVPEQYIPPLAYVPPTGGLFFPTGEWSGWFTSAELVYAIENCGVTARLHEAVGYTVAQPFKPFIDKVFAEKKTATGARREFCKLVLNGCYGKFAQKPENTKLQMFDSAAEGLAWARKNAHKQPLPLNASNTAWAVKTHRWPKQTHYALASFITAYSRILWHRGAVAAQGLAYGDTDSIYCVDAFNVMPKGNDLGWWMEKRNAVNGRFYAPKLYELHCRGEAEYYRAPTKDDRYKPVFASKGFPVSAEAFARIVQGERVGNPKGRMQLLKTQLRKDAGVKHLSEDETAKQWSGRSNKRAVIPFDAEGDTRPWDVRELHEGIHEQQQSPNAPHRPK